MSLIQKSTDGNSWNRHSKRENSFYFLEIACQKTAERFGKPEIPAWVNGDFVRLSQNLFDTAGVQISSNTLKRIFGKIRTKGPYYPQQATRDVMAQYIGFSDWDSFVRETGSSVDSTDMSLQYGRKWLWAIPLVLMGAVSVLVYRGFFAEKKPGLPFRITCRNPTGIVPHSAVFDLKVLDAERLRKGNYKWFFGDGLGKKLDPDKKFYSHYYQEPGRFYAVAAENNGPEVGDTIPVYLPTRGWAAIIRQAHDSTWLYSYKLPEVIRQLKLTKEDVSVTGVDTNDQFIVKFINAYETGISGDNFELTTNVTTSPEYPGHRCSDVTITLCGKMSMHIVKVIKPGCEHWIYRNISEKQNWGMEENMSYLARDLRKGGLLKLVVQNKKMTFFINGEKSFEESYSFPLGQIYSVRVEFYGTGSVNSFHLKDAVTGKLFEGNF